MERLWKAIDEIYRAKYELNIGLRRGAKESEIAAAEKAMSVRLPDDFRASLLVHDGQGKDAEAEWAPGCNRLAPLSAIVAQWKDELEWVTDDDDDEVARRYQCDGRVMNVVFHAKRVPIAGTEFWDGDKTYVDLFPGPKGAAGQIITLVTECDYEVVGATWRQVLEGLLAVLEGGELVRGDDAAELVPKAKGGYKGHPAEWLAARIGKPPAKAKKTAPKKKAAPKKTAKK